VIDGEIVVAQPPALAMAGLVADRVAADSVFAAFQARKAPHTRRRHQADLQRFSAYLADAGIAAGDLYHDPSAWSGVTWGLVAGFVEWQLQQGYAIGSVNVRLATVKTYCQLALHAGALDHDAYIRIKAVKGYSHKGRPQRRPAPRHDAHRDVRRRPPSRSRASKPASSSGSRSIRRRDAGMPS
jgi:hypothetical protein